MSTRLTPTQLVRRYEGRRVFPSGKESITVSTWLNGLTYEEFKATPFPITFTAAEQLDCLLYLRAVEDGKMEPIFNKPCPRFPR